MALVSNGCRNNIPNTELPAGYMPPAVSTFQDFEYQTNNQIVSIAKLGVENADPVATMTAIVAAIVTALNIQITADYDVGALTVTYYSVLKSIATNADLEGVLYTDGTVNYLCTADIFVKTA